MREPNFATPRTSAPAAAGRGDLSSLPGPALTEAVREAGLDLAAQCGESGQPDPRRHVAHDDFERLLGEVERRLGGRP